MSKFAPRILEYVPPWLPAIVESSPFRWFMGNNLARDIFPKLSTINRCHLMSDGEAQQLIMGGATGARLWYAKNRRKMEESRFAKIQELPNEPVTSTKRERLCLVEFTLEAVKLMQADGFTPGVGVFPRGTPQLKAADPQSTALEDLLPIFRLGLPIILHQYAIVPVGKDSAWHELRHRLLLRELQALGVDSSALRLYITESGIDGPGGWRKCKLSESEYIAYLLRIDIEYSTDPQVVCHCPYVIGPTSDWAAFEITERMVRSMAEEVRISPPPVPPQPSPTPKPGTRENPVKSPPLVIDGRCLSVEEFVAHVKAFKWTQPPTSIWLHHTGIPTRADWHGKATLLTMRSYYEQQIWQDTPSGLWYKGWTVGPHFFVADDGIWLFTDMGVDGAHAGGKYNVRSLGLEMVGNYDAELPSGPTLKNTVAALGALFARLGLDPTEIRFHREVENKTCPGAAVKKEWIVPQVQAWIAANELPVGLQEFLGQQAQKAIVPLDPASAFDKYAATRGWLPAGLGIDVQYQDVSYSVQPYRDAQARSKQHIVWAVTGDWGNVHSFDREN